MTTCQRYRLPDRLLVDNGSPWGSRPAHPSTPLTVCLRRLGIAVSHSRPYHPQTLGKDERFHGTLQRDLGGQPPRPDLGAWQAAFDAWRHEYNHGRPHERLALAVPASSLSRQPAAPMPAQLPPLPYGPEDQIRRVQAGGWVCRFRAASSGCPRRCAASPWRCDPPPPMAGWAIRFLSDDLGTLDLRDLA